jgi:hypothetical protein
MVLPIVPPAASVPWKVVHQDIAPAMSQTPQAVSAGVLKKLTPLQIVGSSVAQRVFPVTLPRSSSVALGRAGNETASPRTAADLAWLEQAASGSENSDLHHKKDVAIRALETVFAQYGR